MQSHGWAGRRRWADREASAEGWQFLSQVQGQAQLLAKGTTQLRGRCHGWCCQDFIAASSISVKAQVVLAGMLLQCNSKKTHAE